MAIFSIKTSFFNCQRIDYAKRLFPPILPPDYIQNSLKIVILLFFRESHLNRQSFWYSDEISTKQSPAALGIPLTYMSNFQESTRIYRTRKKAVTSIINVTTLFHIFHALFTEKLFFIGKLCQKLPFTEDMIICILTMRNHAKAAIFRTIFRITEIASTLITQCIQRTVTEKTVKIFLVRYSMAWKIFTFLMAEEFVFTHSCLYFFRKSVIIMIGF